VAYFQVASQQHLAKYTCAVEAVTSAEQGETGRGVVSCLGQA